MLYNLLVIRYTHILYYILAYYYSITNILLSYNYTNSTELLIN